MIQFPKSADKAAIKDGVVRAGSTDLTERRHLGLADGPLIDLRDVADLDRIEWNAGGAKIGARVTLAKLAADEKIRAGYRGFAAAAGELATPQIRAVATLGGSLLQRSRCWYYRSPDAQCLKSGGERCLARGGDHLYHACFDLGPCVAVHPSTLGMALMTYDAQVSITGAASRSVEALLGDGADPRRENTLESGAIVTAITLPPPEAGERSAYFRATSRVRAEWPLVEALARIIVDDDGRITSAAIAVGGVAPVPLRRAAVEAALVGKLAKQSVYEAAARNVADGASPLPMTGYKVDLLPATVLEALERAHETAGT
ncbi:MAG: FAD binding domain-containing protein [Nannocystaceae bacterium]|nr:FAD binding domain-containing protein [Nannocystaceae bacterium]